MPTTDHPIGRRFGVRAATAGAAIALAAAALTGSNAASADASSQAAPFAALLYIYAADHPTGVQTFAFPDSILITNSGPVGYVGLPAGGHTPSAHNDVYFRGLDNHLHVVTGCNSIVNGTCTDTAYGTNRDLGGVITSSPSTARTASGVSAAFARGTDGALWEYRAGTWHSLGGQFVGDPTALAGQARGQLDVFVTNSANQIWDARSTDNGSTFQWRYAGKPVLTDSSASTVAVSTAVVGGTFNYIFLQTSVGPEWDYAFWSMTDAGSPGSLPVSQGTIPAKYDTPRGNWPVQGPVLDGTTGYVFYEDQWRVVTGSYTAGFPGAVAP